MISGSGPGSARHRVGIRLKPSPGFHSSASQRALDRLLRSFRRGPYVLDVAAASLSALNPNKPLVGVAAIWEDDDFHGVVQRGTPVVQCFPVSREDLDLSYASFDANQSASFAQTIDSVLSQRGVYRRQFRVRRGRSPALK